jgi:hypothetical protein
MKFISITILTIILLSGCATKNAFTKLGISDEREKAVENTRTGKLKRDLEIDGVYSAIYLNNVYSSIDNNKIVFYVSIYSKNKDEELKITLNNQEPTEMQKLPKENRFSDLQSMKNNWINNYIVIFQNNNLKKLNLTIENGQFSSGLLNFQTNQL